MNYNLGDILEDKGYIRGPFGSALKRGEMKEIGIPVYEQQNAIYNNREFRYFIDEEKYETLKRFTVKTNDLIISCSGTVGFVSLIEEDDVKGIISQALLILRPNINIVLPKFLKYYFSSKQGRSNLIERSIGSVQVNLAKRNIIESIQINLPSLSEQKKIVYYLDLLTDKLDLNNRIIKNSEEISQTLFKRWFIDFEFPNEEGFPYKSSGGKMVDSELGKIPMGWSIYNLNDFTQSISESINKKEVKFARFLNTSDISEGQVENVELSATEKMPGQAKKLIQNGDILYSEIRPKNKRYAYVNFNADEYVVSTKLMVLRVNEAIYSSKLLYLWLTMPSTVGELQQIAEDRSGTFPQITFSILANFKFAIPPKKILVELIKVLEGMHELQFELKRENRKLIELRDTLLPKVLSGEIEIPDECVVN
ncbi:restriction endonuclease subunit S [Litchfieldia alkalitelluris]|uniref:restriction endonuclease subunit S n=1 Tax=Litchfieldia alkalitelluris TaxID=304268 RepID=UPI000997C78D|nr:restriction endonuclease subunit S [Litchfieldia alkalitelluris]